MDTIHSIPRYLYPIETELPIPHYLNDLELGIQKGGKRTRKYRRTLDERRKNVKRSTKKRKTTRRLQKR